MNILWPVLLIIAVAGLLRSFFSGPSPVWGGATIGLIFGLVWGLVVGEGVTLVMRGAVVGAVVATVGEALNGLLTRPRTADQPPM